MTRPPFPPRCAFRASVTALTAAVLLASCGKDADDAPRFDTTGAERYKAETDEGLGVSVAIVLDNSGSMDDKAPGDNRPKSEVAKDAIQRTLDATEAAIAKRPDYPIKVSLILFSDDTRVIMPMQPYDRDSVRAAIARLPEPVGGTAIGDAMQEARRHLYRSGTFRKVMLVVTDGENNKGEDPALVAQEIFSRSEGGVGMYFVAFDTDPEKFGFLTGVKGEVISAQNGAALQASLATLYQGKVLAESAVEPGAPLPVVDSSRRDAAATSTPRSNP